jgi:hypothetical protein
MRVLALEALDMFSALTERRPELAVVAVDCEKPDVLVVDLLALASDLSAVSIKATLDRL